jgi:hypothetical protein
MVIVEVGIDYGDNDYGSDDEHDNGNNAGDFDGGGGGCGNSDVGDCEGDSGG